MLTIIINNLCFSVRSKTISKARDDARAVNFITNAVLIKSLFKKGSISMGTKKVWELYTPIHVFNCYSAI